MLPLVVLPADAPYLRARLARFIAGRLLEAGWVTQEEVDDACLEIARQLAAEAPDRTGTGRNEMAGPGGDGPA